MPLSTAAVDATGELLGKHDNSPYGYVRITVRNNGGTKVGYRFESNSDYSGRGRITISAPALDPGDTRIHNLAVPFIRYPSLTITDTLGERKPVAMGNYSYSGNGRRFLNICELEKFATEKELDDFTRQYAGGGPVGGAGSSTPDRVISQIEPRDLPENWMCYAPFHSVFIRQTALGRLPQSEQDAMMRWVQSGGFLSVYGADKDSTESLGLGVLERRKDSPINLTGGDFPSEWRRTEQLWQQFYGTSGGESNFPYMVQKPGGRTGAFFIATLFLVLAGPINYFYYKRKGRIRMLMISLPAISLGFCTLITGYFIGTQGFARRGGTVSVATLNERLDQGFAFARSTLYSGLYPLGGFRFKPETVFLPVRSADNYEIDMTNGTLLSSGLFQPSTNFHYFTASPFHTRERLIWDPQASTVINGFEKALEGVIVETGGRYFAGGKVPAGGKVTLSPVSGSDVPAMGAGMTYDDRIVRLLAQRVMSADERRVIEERMSGFAAAVMKVPGAHYAVLMTQNPSYIETGVTIDALRNCNVLVGLSDDSTTTSQGGK
ncbi:MAG: hypothetical protein ACR2IE_07585 [Candidatus Sumerlaeaceae bacterium]